MKGIWLSLSPTDRRALTVGLLVVSLSLLAVYAILPLVRAEVALADELTDQRAIRQRENTILAGVPRLRERVGALEQVVGTIGPQLFAASEGQDPTNALSAFVASLAQRNRVFLQERIGLDAVKDSSGLLKLGMVARGVSDLRGILGLVDDLETSAKLLRVVGMTIERTAPSPGVPTENGLALILVIEGYALGPLTPQETSADAVAR